MSSGASASIVLLYPPIDYAGATHPASTGRHTQHRLASKYGDRMTFLMRFGVGELDEGFKIRLRGPLAIGPERLNRDVGLSSTILFRYLKQWAVVFFWRS